eukprot:scaffold199988_cov15-Tisochrysis_lutea.AAC.1
MSPTNSNHHTGIGSGECAGTISKHQVSLVTQDRLAKGSQGPGSSPCFEAFWLAKVKSRQPSLEASSSPALAPKLIYLPDLRDESHMRLNHRFSFLKGEAFIYHCYLN